MKNKFKAFFYAFRDFFIFPAFATTILLFVFIYMKLFCALSGYGSVVSGIKSDDAFGIILCTLMLVCATIYVLYVFACYVSDCRRAYKDELEELKYHE